MSTNYRNTFIRVAPDSPTRSPEVPPLDLEKPSVAALQHRLLAEHPYELTSDELLFTVHAERQGIAEPERDAARAAFFAKSQACLRASPLSKRYGWGTHHDDDGRVALVGVGTEEYERLAVDQNLEQKTAMRSRRTSKRPSSLDRSTNFTVQRQTGLLVLSLNRTVTSADVADAKDD